MSIGSLVFPQAIIFDLDGTLIDSEKRWHDVVVKFLAEYGKTYDEKIHATMFGLAMGDFVDRLRIAYGIDEDAEQLMRKLIDYSDAMNAITPSKAQPGVFEMIEYLEERQIPRAIATNSRLRSMEIKLAHHDWRRFFPTRCSAEQVAKGKPAPDVYLYAAAQLRVAPEYCIAVEDSLNGARAAVAAGMTCFVVPDLPNFDHLSFTDVTPHIFENLCKALELLRDPEQSKEAISA